MERSLFLNNNYYSLKNKTVMKTNKLFGFAAIVCGFAMSMTSCSEADNAVEEPVAPTKSYVISFENQTLNADGYWCGDETGTAFDNWGATGYACTYTEDVATFPVNYTPAWGSWSGVAISSRIELGEKGAVVKGFFYTNNAWTVDAILHGDGMTPGAFEDSDYLKCIVTGTKLDDTTATVEIDLAKDGDYAWRWLYTDLSSLGKVKSLTFSFDGSKKNDWGLTTPTYICIDDIEIEY
jgi:hypothetical protein